MSRSLRLRCAHHRRSVHRLAWMVVSAALLIAGVMVHADAPGEPYGQWLAILSGLVFLWGIVSKT